MRLKQLLFSVACVVSVSVRAQVSQQIGSTTVWIDTLTTDVTIPWEMKVEGEDYLWVTERGGLVSRIHLGTGTKTVVLDLTADVHTVGESGLLGFTFHPDFPGTPEVFLVYTYGPEDSNGYFKERLVKYTFNGINLENPDILLDNILAWANHNGSRLHFLPDNTLLMSTGECSVQELSQDSSSLSGKYLRLNPDGSIPADNPVPGSYVYTMGHRNSQGICALPNGKILISEHGPSTDDELQVLEPGKNYGWPLIHGFCDESFENAPCATGLYQEPIHAWTPTIATSDLVFYENPAFPEWNNRVLMTTLNGQKLVAMELDAQTTAVVDEVLYLQSQFGRLRDIAIGPDKEIYLATNSGQHPIIRIVPPTTLELNEPETGDEVSIVPNPAGNTIRLSVPKAADLVTIYDLSGKIVWQKTGLQSGEEMEISRLGQGTYQVEVQLTETGKVYRQKLMK